MDRKWCAHLLDVVCLLFQDAEGFPIDIQISDNGDGTFFCVYVPTKPIKHTVIITWGDVNIPNSPFRVLLSSSLLLPLLPLPPVETFGSCVTVNSIQNVCVCVLVCVCVCQVTIGEGSHPENVRVYGPGIEKSGLKANEPTYFTVDCSEAGQGASTRHLLHARTATQVTP